ncbi:MAG: LysR family transcriptional regulator [Gracilibacteraceae bacterium]|nr:LysR family transcriptional regulator [Gracilibacteraceae bacterium]
MNTVLEVFCKVADTGSFTKAAQSLFLSQSAVSQQISNAEEEYGVRLFLRGHREVSLTPEGKILYAYAKRILSLYKSAAEELSQKSGIVSGSIIVGASCTVGEYILPLILGKYKHLYPLVNLLFHVGNNEYVLAGIRQNKFDLGFVGEPCNLQNLESELFTQDEMVLIAAPAHPLAQKASVTFEDICSVPFIIRENGTGTRRFIEDLLRRNGLTISDLEIWMEYGSFESIKRFVQTGMGITMISRWAVEQEIGLKLLRILPMEGVSLKRNFLFVYNKGYADSQLINGFKTYCRESTVALL